MDKLTYKGGSLGIGVSRWSGKDKKPAPIRRCDEVALVQVNVNVKS